MSKKISAVLYVLLYIAVYFSAQLIAFIAAPLSDTLLRLFSGYHNLTGLIEYFIYQAEAHFNTIDMTQSQADKINGIISAGRAFLESTGKSNIKELSSSQKQTLLSYASQAAGVLKLTAVAGSDENRIKITTKGGTVIVDESNNIIKTTGFSSLTLTTAAGSVFFAALISASAVLLVLKKRELKYEKN